MSDLAQLTKVENEIEALIDRHGLYNIVQSIETICYGKADHLSANWQEHSAAKRWRQAGKACDVLYNKLRKIQLD